MISYILDTNVILRFLLDDIPYQAKEAKLLIEKIENNKAYGIISLLVINEIIWALGKFYEISNDKICDSLLKLMSLKNMKVLETSKEDIIQILKVVKKEGLDFTDLYLAWIGKNETYTLCSFDKKLLKFFHPQ